MSTGYLSFTAGHPYTWGSLGIVLFLLGFGFLLPRFGVHRRRQPPAARKALALYLWAASALCFVAVFFVPLRLRFFTETSLYYHAGLLAVGLIVLWLRRVGLFIVFGLLLALGSLVPLYHSSWRPVPPEGRIATLRVLAVSSGTVSLELDLLAAGSGSVLGPIELAGSLITLETEVVTVPDPLFFLGFAHGYRLLRILSLDQTGEPSDEWPNPGAGNPVPLVDDLTLQRVETVNLRPILMERYAVTLEPGGNQVLSYKQL